MTRSLALLLVLALAPALPACGDQCRGTARCGVPPTDAGPEAGTLDAAPSPEASTPDVAPVTCEGGATVRECVGQCVDLATDRNNCGSCGHVCMQQDTCTGGFCP